MKILALSLTVSAAFTQSVLAESCTANQELVQKLENLKKLKARVFPDLKLWTQFEDTTSDCLYYRTTEDQFENYPEAETFCKSLHPKSTPLQIRSTEEHEHFRKLTFRYRLLDRSEHRFGFWLHSKTDGNWLDKAETDQEDDYSENDHSQTFNLSWNATEYVPQPWGGKTWDDQDLKLEDNNCLLFDALYGGISKAGCQPGPCQEGNCHIIMTTICEIRC